ncbi:hypothetical protein GRJ2_000485800 [Grus japonensis]|uniref:Uncharacterized protein n=1 Tax=Grus japonensis TaxID=30415 RepID=A0ABC9W3P0_GRUJA
MPPAPAWGKPKGGFPYERRAQPAIAGNHSRGAVTADTGINRSACNKALQKQCPGESNRTLYSLWKGSQQSKPISWAHHLQPPTGKLFAP